MHCVHTLCACSSATVHVHGRHIIRTMYAMLPVSGRAVSMYALYASLRGAASHSIRHQWQCRQVKAHGHCRQY